MEKLEKWRGKNALVAGANSGIGAMATLQFLENGINVYGLDKDIDELEGMKKLNCGGNLTILQTDVTEDEEVQKSIDWLAENTTSIDIVVYSIGIIANNNLIDGEYAEWENVLNINFIGLSVCLKGLINLMLNQNVKNGQIIMMNGKGSEEIVYLHEAHFLAAIDTATAALIQGLRYELKERKSSIKISTIHVGLVRTNYFKTDGERALLNTFVPLTTDDVMDAIAYILSAPNDILVNKIIMDSRGYLKQQMLIDSRDKIETPFLTDF